MSSSIPHQFKTTTAATITPAAVVGLTIPQTSIPQTYRVVSDVAIHLKWAARGAGVSATVSDGYLPANCIEYVTLGPNDQIEVVGAAGVTTGTAWFTHVGG